MGLALFVLCDTERKKDEVSLHPINIGCLAQLINAENQKIFVSSCGETQADQSTLQWKSTKDFPGSCNFIQEFSVSKEINQQKFILDCVNQKLADAFSRRQEIVVLRPGHLMRKKREKRSVAWQ